jgi:hypothetical protein
MKEGRRIFKEKIPSIIVTSLALVLVLSGDPLVQVLVQPESYSNITVLSCIVSEATRGILIFVLSYMKCPKCPQDAKMPIYAELETASLPSTNDTSNGNVDTGGIAGTFRQ